MKIGRTIPTMPLPTVLNGWLPRIISLSLLGAFRLMAQTSESTYISDLTSTIANIFSTTIYARATPLPRVKFSAHELPIDGPYLNTFITAITANCPASTAMSYTSWTSTCLLKAYADGLINMGAGVDRIDINIWIAPYAQGNTTVELIYANLINYIHSQTCNGHTCEVELNPADNSLTELSPPCSAITTTSGYRDCLTLTTSAMVTMATDSNYTLGQPESFTVVHECSTQNTRFSWDGVTPDQGTAADWRGFVDTVASKLSTAHYTGKIGAGGCLYWEDGATMVGPNIVPNFCGDSHYGFNSDSNLQYITYDIYNALSTSGASNYDTNVMSRSPGNYVSEIAATVAAGWTDVRIEESARPPFVYSYGIGPTASLADIEPNTTFDNYFGCGWSDWNALGLDRQWLDMITKFASSQKMTSVSVFYTFPFFWYTNGDAHADCNPAAAYPSDVVTNFLGSASGTGTYYSTLSTHWPTVIATGSVKLMGRVKLQ